MTSEPSFWGLSQTGWIAVAAVLTGFMAVATAVLAGFTWRSVAAARREITATESLVRESQLDRELNWRPYLLYVGSAWASSSSDRDPDTIILKNIGRGIAFNATFARYSEISRGGGAREPIVRISKTLKVISPDEDSQISAPPQDAPSELPSYLFEDASGAMVQEPTPILAIFYQDTLSQRVYRLLPPRATADTWASDPKEDAPQWASWYLGWIKEYSPA